MPCSLCRPEVRALSTAARNLVAATVLGEFNLFAAAKAMERFVLAAEAARDVPTFSDHLEPLILRSIEIADAFNSSAKWRAVLPKIRALVPASRLAMDRLAGHTCEPA